MNSKTSTNMRDSLAFQRKLRAHWQTHTSVCYCLYGSKRHMLLSIFNDYSMPFYKFGDILFLQKSDEKTGLHLYLNGLQLPESKYRTYCPA